MEKRGGTMDILIEKGTTAYGKDRYFAGSLGILITDVDDALQDVQTIQEEIPQRNGTSFRDSVIKKKTIKATGLFYAKSEFDFEEKKDLFNERLFFKTPTQIRKMVSVNKDMYKYENPGTGKSLRTIDLNQRGWKYFYNAVSSRAIEYEFLGKSNQGLLFKISIEYETAGVPYGIVDNGILTIENVKKNTDYFIDYYGTASCSQLEVPWTVVVRPSNRQLVKGDSLEIGERKFTATNTIKTDSNGDISLGGTSFTSGGYSFAGECNCEYFVLEPTPEKKIVLRTNFECRHISVINLIECYT